jgi:hypothetical protein
MRSSTVFIVIGVLIALVLIVSAVQTRATAQHPAVRAATDLLQAVREQDLAKATSLLDLTWATVDAPAGKIISIKFKKGMVIDAAFGNRPEVRWTSLDIAGMKADPQMSPTINADQGLADLPLLGGEHIYIHPVAGTWKVFYIAEAKPDK